METTTIKTDKSSVLDRMVEKFQRRIDKLSLQSGDGLKSTLLAYEVMRDYYLEGTRAKEEGRACTIYDGYAAQEVVSAMDVYSLNVEFLAYHMVHDCAKYVEVASSHGFATDMCTSTRMEAGIVIAEELPRPDFVVTSAITCDSCYKSCHFFAHYYDTPIFALDCPYNKTEENIRYYADEHRQLVKFLEEVTGQKFDIEKLRETEDRTYETYRLLKELLELRKAVPSPIRARDALRNMGITIMSRSKAKAFDYFKSLLAEVRDRVEKKQGVVENEKYRLLWLQTAPLFTDFFKVLEEEYGAVVVLDELSAIDWNEERTSDPFYDIAKRGMSNSWWGEMSENRTQTILKQAEDYKIDGCIHFLPWGCRVSSNAAGVIKDALMKEMGVPTLTLDSCYMDPNLFVESQVKAKMEGFIEIMEK